MPGKCFTTRKIARLELSAHLNFEQVLEMPDRVEHVLPASFRRYSRAKNFRLYVHNEEFHDEEVTEAAPIMTGGRSSAHSMM